MIPPPAVRWPGGHQFAFTIFDDPDAQTLSVGREVYSLLTDLGFRTTKGIWPVHGPQGPSDRGRSCEDPDYREWVLGLKALGFELGLHNVTFHTSTRLEIERGLVAFNALAGEGAGVLAQHFNCGENLYWGDKRVSGWRRMVYNLMTRGTNRGRFHGEDPSSPSFWGDLCQERITYVRNFVFAGANTLAACPFMPYHDPDRPFVNYWYASSEGANLAHFTRTLNDASIDRLAEEGGACIMYTHFGHGFVDQGRVASAFRRTMERLSRLGGWFAPVSAVLDHLRTTIPRGPITLAERASLERLWLWHKARFGTA